MNKVLRITLVLLLTISGNTLRAEGVLEKKILQEINQYRNSKGLASLSNSSVIAQQAQKHSADMALHAIKFGHQFFQERITKIYATLPNCQAGAENVAYNYKPNVIVAEWIKSPGHRQNIIGNYNLSGIGVAKDKQGRLYFTQMFIRQARSLKT